MELEITGKGADLQNVFVLIFFKSPRNNAGPLSQERLTSFDIQKLIEERRAYLLLSEKLTGRSLEKALNLLDPPKSKT